MESERNNSTSNSHPATVFTKQTDDDPVPLPPHSRFQEIITKNYPELSGTLLMASDGTTLLQITHILVHNHPPAGYVHRVRVILTPTPPGYHCDLQVLLVSVDKGVITSDQEFTQVCKGLLQSNGFVFCPRIGCDKYNDEYLSVIRFHCKQVNVSVALFQRVDSIGCLRW